MIILITVTIQKQSIYLIKIKKFTSMYKTIRYKNKNYLANFLDKNFLEEIQRNNFTVKENSLDKIKMKIKKMFL